MAHSPPSPPFHDQGDSGPANPASIPNAPSRSNGPSSTPYSHIRSCTLCRQRKVKCDRQHPCSSCARTRGDCVYPPGPGRAAKRPRKALDGQLLGRLSKLEGIIKRLQSQSPNQGQSQGQSQVTQEPDIPKPIEEETRQPLESVVTQNLGRLMIDEKKSYYIGNILWAELGNDIEELRDMLHESSSEDSENQGLAATPSSSLEEAASPSTVLQSNAAILGYRSLAHSLRSFHPPLQQSVELFTAFSENVLPVVHVFHMPTTARVYWDAVSALESPVSAPLDKDTEALLFAIYYSAATSLDVAPDTLAQYRFATEQALARANLLTTQSITVLQAVVLFLTALRNEDETRTVWSLTGLVFHIAQAMGLHRDGTAFGLRPLETEIRRRLWCNICVLDTRSSDYHGYEPIVRESGFDTQLPLNINDADLTADMREFPPECDDKFTEMTFTRIRGEIIKAGWKLSYVPPNTTPGPQADVQQSVQARETVVENLRKSLEKYLQCCNPEVPFQALSSTVARVVVARMWLIVHFPLGRRGQDASTTTRGANKPDRDMRDKLFMNALEILELTSFILSKPEFARWAWHSRTYMPWHAGAFMLSEICLRPPSPECDRAWECINIVKDCVTVKNKDKKGALWRPIERLTARAQCVREKQKGNPSIRDHATVLADQPSSVYLSEQELSGIGLSPVPSYPLSGNEGVGFTTNIHGMLDTGSLDPFLESFPDSMQDELFDTFLNYHGDFQGAQLLRQLQEEYGISRIT